MALGTTTNPGDNVAVPELTREDVSAILTQPLEQTSTFLAAGPRIFDTNGSSLRIPRLPEYGGDELEFVGENEEIPESDPTFSELRLLPDTMESIKVLVRFSNELARQAIVPLESVLRQRLVADVAGRIDAQFLGATGDGITTPKGLGAYTAGDGVQIVNAGGPLDLDTILGVQGLALAANLSPDNLTLFIRPENYTAMRGLKDNDGRYLLQPNATAGGFVVPALGTKVAISARVPAGQAYLVDMSHVAIARDLDPSVKVLSETFGNFDQQAIRVVARYDLGMLQPKALVKVTGITAA